MNHLEDERERKLWRNAVLLLEKNARYEKFCPHCSETKPLEAPSIGE